jgi:Ca-activated chloride channel family protein
MTVTRLLAAALLAGVQIGAPGPETLVRIGVTLETTSGLPVLEIDCGRFEIRVEDRVQPLRGCRNGVPVTVALLFDVSASAPRTLTISSMIDELAARLRPVDRVGAGWFGPAVQPPTTFTRDRRALDAVAEAAAEAADDSARGAGGPSPLWDALAATVEALRREPGRRAVVVVTDGRATGNNVRFPIAAREVVMSGVEMHVIGPTFANVPPERVATERDLMNRPAMIALATGGTATPLGRGSELVKPQLRAILEGLQRSYELTFAAAPGGQGGDVRRLDVRVNAPGLVVRAPDRFGIR